MLTQLFPRDPDQPQNILPKDGTALYYGPIFSAEECARWEQELLRDIPWQPDQVRLFGEVITTKREIAWFGEKSFNYEYSGIVKTAHIFTPPLRTLKQSVEERTGFTYNSCLLNLYHDGSQGMAYHSDGERALKLGGAIASLTFGAARKFSFKHKISGERIDIVLENGSLLVMKDEIQQFWLHRLPPTKKVTTPRVNLTFRTIINDF